MAANTTDRFLDKVQFEPMSGCWLWAGALSGSGYGVYKINGVDWSAHRAAVGYIPDTLVVDHLCNIRTCVNPDHLRVCTQKENVLRSNGVAAVNSRKTHCPRGHEYTSDNLRADKKGKRCCLTCHRDRERNRREQSREAPL